MAKTSVRETLTCINKMIMIPTSKRKLNFVRKKVLKEVGERELIEPQRYIYESPDNGKTVYRRNFNEYDKKERIK